MADSIKKPAPRTPAKRQAAYCRRLNDAGWRRITLTVPAASHATLHRLAREHRMMTGRLFEQAVELVQLALAGKAAS